MCISVEGSPASNDTILVAYGLQPSPPQSGIELWRRYARSESFRRSPEGSRQSSPSTPHPPTGTQTIQTVSVVVPPVVSNITYEAHHRAILQRLASE